MASNTPNYNLIKPDPSEFYDVDVNNQNMDTIDAELKNNADDISSAGQSLDNHKLDTTNPHQVNKSQVGLGNVDNVQQASKSEFNILSNDFTSHQADVTTHSTYKLSPDANGIFTEVQFKREDGTLISNSVLSGGTSPQYTTRTETYYELDGTTVKFTNTYTISYDIDGKVTSEVLQ